MEVAEWARRGVMVDGIDNIDMPLCDVVTGKSDAGSPSPPGPSSALMSPISQTDSLPSLSESPPEQTFISVSTTFFPGANTDSLPTDLILLSSDAVFFYVHSQRLLAASENGFNSNLPSTMQKKTDTDPDPIITLPEHSTIINIILHTIYGMSCAHYNPGFEELSTTVSTLKKYGLSVQRCLAPNTPLTLSLLAHAPYAALELYTLAAHHDVHHLALTVSPHLLTLQLATLSDDIVAQMGPVYLKRLFFLHMGRTEALKRHLLPPPSPHGPLPTCDVNEQKKVTRAWALASAYLTWDARPDMTEGMIESALAPLGDHLTCQLCKDTLRDRIRELCTQWAQVKKTI